ncbi:MAG: hypothetical protein ACTHJT_05835 [Cytophaga sp.]|uniref:hypothetical protein n=1 Tax=Cytophaga sp. TaxID=29535 RepID=UPI003F7DE939
MVKHLIILTFFPVLISCGSGSSMKTKQINTDSLKQENAIRSNAMQDTLLVKKWLTQVITDYVNSDDSKVAYDSLRTKLTEDYYNYKYEAITLEYSEMTEKEFHEKWKTKYQTKYVGTGGFFTPVIDNGTIEIIGCNVLKSFGDSCMIFYTAFRDLRWKTDYLFDVKVISRNNKLLIDDVKEYK